ncbi:MAG: response regulator [Geminicoccaceae bacterium]
MFRVVIADDHPLFRDAIRLALSDVGAGETMEIVDAASADEAKALADQHDDLDLLLLDLRMPGMNGLAGLIELRRRHPALPIAVVSATDNPKIMRDCLDLGAMAYIPKSYDRRSIASAIEDVLAGRMHLPEAAAGSAACIDADASLLESVRTLTPQQLRVLQAIAEGKPNKIIAHELGIAVKTVKAHVTVILRKLGVTNRTQAVLAASRIVASED